MRILKATLLGLFCSSMAFGQVTTMNVYQNNGVLLQVPVSAIDSVTLSTTPPPSMSIYQTGGSVSTIVLANIDSITYTVATNPPPPSGNWLNPNLTYGSVTDCSGNTYATIEIGTQEWMAENLRTTCYANGDELETVYWNNNANNPFQEFYVEWHNLADDGAWCHYEADDQYDIPYGKLYNGYAVDDSRNVCPDGWHVPDTTDWYTLLLFLDSTTTVLPSSSPTNTNASAGEQLKSTYESWQQPNYANNSSGFSAIAGGIFHDGFNPEGWGLLDGAAYFHINGYDSVALSSSVTYPVYPGISDSEAVSIRCIKD